MECRFQAGQSLLFAKKSSHFLQSMLESKETGDYYLYTGVPAGR